MHVSYSHLSVGTHKNGWWIWLVVSLLSSSRVESNSVRLCVVTSEPGSTTTESASSNGLSVLFSTDAASGMLCFSSSLDWLIGFAVRSCLTVIGCFVGVMIGLRLAGVEARCTYFASSSSLQRRKNIIDEKLPMEMNVILLVDLNLPANTADFNTVDCKLIIFPFFPAEGNQLWIHTLAQRVDSMN